MGHRLTKIYTRTGDDGTTGLADGSRVAKDDARIEAIGTVDELNSAIGLLLTEDLSVAIKNPLTAIQHQLFDIGAELSLPDYASVTETHITQLENLIDHFNADLEPLKEFILPGGSRAASVCHLCRTICRRAERRLITLNHSEKISAAILKYLNRLSDLLFVLCRVINKDNNHPDVLWQPAKEKPRS
jgi:cob(I)alamin adenosyltransferase